MDVIGADDFASMREIVFRRYSRLIAEGAELPDLIIVDGGKGQPPAPMPCCANWESKNKSPS